MMCIYIYTYTYIGHRCLRIYKFVLIYMYIHVFLMYMYLKVDKCSGHAQVQHLVREAKKTRKAKLPWLREMKAWQNGVLTGPVVKVAALLKAHSYLMDFSCGQELLSSKLLERKFIRGKKSSSESLESPAGDTLHCSRYTCVTGVVCVCVV